MATSRKNEVKNEVSLQEASLNDLAIPELAQYIENKKIDPKALDKIVLEKLAIYYKSRRAYKTEDIAELLQVCSRTIERYIANVRSTNSLAIGVNFQNELIEEILNNLRLRYQRLWRLSYSDNLSDFEKARVIFMCDQIEINEVMLLSRLGYLSREQGLDAIESVKEETEEVGRSRSESVKKQLSLLNSQQWRTAYDFFKVRMHEIDVVLEKMVKDYLAENERQKTMAGDVAVFVKLYCSVFVVKGLHS
ncbi:MAG: hypothetical protein M0R20_03620 [Candidatus Omnitrophica bacterium]|jgi:hypothetical protein|nr:hypothetical protein [Candidatus Omnitrophota bacterium]